MDLFKKLLILAIISPVNAFALDWTQPLLDQDGAPVSACDRDHPTCGKVLTLGDIASMSLFTNFQDETNITGEEKFKRATLAMKLKSATDFTPSAEDVATIKRLVAKAYPPLTVMRVWLAIDPGAKP